MKGNTPEPFTEDARDSKHDPRGPQNRPSLDIIWSLSDSACSSPWNVVCNIVTSLVYVGGSRSIVAISIPCAHHSRLLSYILMQITYVILLLKDILKVPSDIPGAWWWKQSGWGKSFSSKPLQLGPFRGGVAVSGADADVTAERIPWHSMALHGTIMAPLFLRTRNEMYTVALSWLWLAVGCDSVFWNDSKTLRNCALEQASSVRPMETFWDVYMQRKRRRRRGFLWSDARALPCLAYSTSCQEAVAQDDFEGAIKIRSEIKAGCARHNGDAYCIILYIILYHIVRQIPAQLWESLRLPESHIHSWHLAV